MLPGVYLTQTGTPTNDQVQLAALLYAGPGSVLTGSAAIRRHKLRSAGPDTIDVLITWKRKRQSAGSVLIRRTRRMPAPGALYSTGEIRFAAPARAVTDAALSFTSLDDVRTVVADAVQKHGCSIAEIGLEADHSPTRSTRLLQKALAELRAGVRSAAEGQLHELLQRSGLEMPMFNATLLTSEGVQIALVDAWWPQAGVAVEIDSQEFHYSRSEWQETMSRHSTLTRYGILAHHFPPSRLGTDPGGVISDIRASLRQGAQRPQLPIIALPPPG
jgi:hypothetical protein